MVETLFDALPLWGLLLLTLGIVCGISEWGFWLGAGRARLPKLESEGQINALTGAHLGLLAFIMAFSFSLAADQAGNRKRLVLDEANAIEIAHQTAGLLDSPKALEIQRQLRGYAQLRADALAIIATEGFSTLVARSEQAHSRILAQLKGYLDNSGMNQVDAKLVESINKLVAVHNQRVVAGSRSRLPNVIWLSLYTLLLLSMMGMGYYSGIKGQRSPLASTALAISFSVVMVLIADLDRPREGLLKPDQSLMAELHRRLSENARK